MRSFYHASHIVKQHSDAFEKAINVVAEGYDGQGLEVEIQYRPFSPTSHPYTALIIAYRPESR